MKILAATGGSPHSEIALRFCAHLTQLIGPDPAVLTVLTVIKHGDKGSQARVILTRAGQLLDRPASELQTKIRVGHPAEEIIREAEEGAYKLVVVGERQQHGLAKRFILSSTAERVVERAPCPVIIAKGKISPIHRILLCDSGIETPSLLDRFKTQLGGLFKGEEEITILHVMSQISAGPGVRGKQLRANAEELIEEHTVEGQLLERDIRTLEQMKFRPRPKVRHGLVVDEILAEARSGDYDLVVIGAHRGEGWRRILLDDLAHQLLVQMDRPIIVVR
jgi:nucleotide-binding universal stress UspA family protein